MGIKAKFYSREFINRAIRLCDETSGTWRDVARDLDVEYVTLYGWMRKAGKRKRQAAAPTGGSSQTPEAMQAEIQRLQRELEETKKQLEFAKKAAAFFAQQNK